MGFNLFHKKLFGSTDPEMKIVSKIAFLKKLKSIKMLETILFYSDKCEQ